MSPVAHDNSNTAAIWGAVTVENRTKIVLRQPRCQIGTKTGSHKQPCCILLVAFRKLVACTVLLTQFQNKKAKHTGKVSATCFFACQIVLNVIQKENYYEQWKTHTRGTAGPQPPPPKTPQNGNVKTPDIVDTMVWRVLIVRPSAEISWNWQTTRILEFKKKVKKKTTRRFGHCDWVTEHVVIFMYMEHLLFLLLL